MASSGIKGRYARRLHPYLLALRAVRAAALDAAPDTPGGQRTAQHRGTDAGSQFVVLCLGNLFVILQATKNRP
jgi:hypothetical protein